MIHELVHRLDLESTELVRWAWPGQSGHPISLALIAETSNAYKQTHPRDPRGLQCSNTSIKPLYGHSIRT